jgi:hypothetical protein
MILDCWQEAPRPVIPHALVILSEAKDLCNFACVTASAGQKIPSARKKCGPKENVAAALAAF